MMGWRGIYMTTAAGCAAVVALVCIEARTAAGGRASVRGSLEPVSQPAVARYGGAVAEVCVRAGQPVRAGDVLVRFDATDLRARRRESEQALRAVEAAVRNQEAARRTPEQVRAYLLESDPRIVEAEAAYAKALAAFDRAPGNRREAAKRDLEQAGQRRTRVRMEAARAMGQQSAAGQLPALLARVREDRDNIDRLIAESEVRAPAEGVVDLLSVRPGDRVLPGRVLAVLKISGEYACDLAAQESDGVRLRPGMPLRAILEGSRQPLGARVESVSRRRVPEALRENRAMAEEWILRARVSSSAPLPAGAVAEFQLP